MRMRTAILAVGLLALFGTALVSWGQTPAPQVPAPQAIPQFPPQPAGPERFQGTLVNQGGPGSQIFQAGLFWLQIDRYGTDQEAMDLIAALKTGGQKALLAALWKMKQTGYIKVSGTMGYPIVFARSRSTPAGRVIRALTNRPIAPGEFNKMLRSVQYPFGYVEILLPNEGKGEGRLIVAAQVDFTASGSISVESFGLMPFRLMDVAQVQPPAPKK